MSEYNANQLSVNENLISRKQAIEKVKAYKIFAPTDGVEKTLNAVIEAIAHSIVGLPAADVVERPKEADYTVENALKQKAERRGRWIRTGEDGYCSVCKCDMPMFRNDWEWEYTETPYCPNCGARMEAAE